jgi:hypothetical protein
MADPTKNVDHDLEHAPLFTVDNGCATLLAEPASLTEKSDISMAQINHMSRMVGVDPSLNVSHMNNNNSVVSDIDLLNPASPTSIRRKSPVNFDSSTRLHSLYKHIIVQE